MTLIRRAWSGTCRDGRLRDAFANAVARRITEESHDAAVQGCPPVLAGDFLDRCDALFAAHADGISTPAQAQRLADETDIHGLYELSAE